MLSLLVEPLSAKSHLGGLQSKPTNRMAAVPEIGCATIVFPTAVRFHGNADLLSSSFQVQSARPAALAKGRAERAARDFSSFVPADGHPGEILAVVSTTHPLFVMRQVLPTSGQQVFEIAFPQAPERSLLVIRGAQDGVGTKYVSVAIGGVPVPLTALNVYLTRRVAAQPFLDPGSMVQIPSILATGPIELIVLSGVVSRDRDPVLMPENASVTRIPLGDATRVDISNR